MKYSHQIRHKVLGYEEMRLQINRWRFLEKKISFLEGRFDILYPGHLELLSQAAAMVDILVAGVYSDRSFEGEEQANKPVFDEHFRAALISGFVFVDAVIIFDQDALQELLVMISPDIFVKAGSLKIDDIAGADEVIRRGGAVKIFPEIKGLSGDKLHKKFYSF